MKKIIISLLLSFTYITNANDTTSHTFFSIRPSFHGAMPEKISGMYDRLLARPEGIKSSLQITPFGGQSINHKEIARFFLPYNKTCLVTGEFGSKVVQEDTVDIIANYFGVLTRPINEVFGGMMGLNTSGLTYQSIITLNPQQTTAGVGLSYQQTVHSNDIHNLWLQFSMPIIWIKNDLGFSETITHTGGGETPKGFVSTVGDALRGKTVFDDQQFFFGKISDCPLTKVGVGDIEIALGFDNDSCLELFRMWYFGAIIPTGNKPTAEYIFEPIVGNNGHWGIMLGSSYAYEFWTNCDESIRVQIHAYANSHYLFSNVQRRSFDLVDKQWSRYIWLYQNFDDNGSILNITPGINILTQNVRVFPRTSNNANVSLFLTTDCGFMAEGGYNTYYRQGEYLELLNCSIDQAMIAGFNEQNTSLFATKSNATSRHYLLSQGIDIDKNPDGSPKIVLLKQSDLNLCSAAQPPVIAHILYGTLGYRWDDIEFPTMIAIGGSYEFSSDNTGLHRWTAWGKLAFSF